MLGRTNAIRDVKGSTDCQDRWDGWQAPWDVTETPGPLPARGACPADSARCEGSSSWECRKLEGLVPSLGAGGWLQELANMEGISNENNCWREH